MAVCFFTFILKEEVLYFYQLLDIILLNNYQYNASMSDDNAFCFKTKQLNLV